MKRMSMKAYRVWMAVLQNPQMWLDATQIAATTPDLTPRQVVSILSDVRGQGIERDVAADRPRQIVRFHGSKAELEERKREVIANRYQITQEHITAVYNALSPQDWTSVSQISKDTGYSKANIAKILRVMPSDRLCLLDTGSNVLYRRA